MQGLRVLKTPADSHVAVFGDGRVGVSVEDAGDIPEGREVVSLVLMTDAEAAALRERTRDASADFAAVTLGAWRKLASSPPA